MQTLVFGLWGYEGLRDRRRKTPLHGQKMYRDL